MSVTPDCKRGAFRSMRGQSGKARQHSEETPRVLNRLGEPLYPGGAEGELPSVAGASPGNMLKDQGMMSYDRGREKARCAQRIPARWA